MSRFHIDDLRTGAQTPLDDKATKGRKLPADSDVTVQSGRVIRRRFQLLHDFTLNVTQVREL